VNRHAHIQSPGVSGEGAQGLGSGLGGEKSRTQLLQQVMCQRHEHVAQNSPCLEPSASNSQEAARSDCRFRSPYLDATEQTMSDRSDSDFIQRPSSTRSRQPTCSEPVIEVDRSGRWEAADPICGGAITDPVWEYDFSRVPRPAHSTFREQTMSKDCPAKVRVRFSLTITGCGETGEPET
jgi:hypothetical protein